MERLICCIPGVKFEAEIVPVNQGEVYLTTTARRGKRLALYLVISWRRENTGYMSHNPFSTGTHIHHEFGYD
ncbi:hypothetical protein E2C01_001692 [Portunus trituberculatus]|uniref:Uncharacterized protein n=1 Tax=Portunus trituberculatus TaxID=210409 RepID=A0A5B7CHY5_PORTR|nr:hypothetical protein [Portunus trituberculatus]